VDNGRQSRFVDWSIAARPLSGEAESGDRALVVVSHDAALVAAVDGLGHGREAARAAEPAVETLRAFADEPLVVLAERCDAALRHSRGAALSLARFSASHDTVTWIGIGNVEGRLVRSDGSAAISVESLIPARGIAGDHLPELDEATLPIHPGDLLLLATDGIDSAFADSLRPYGTAEELAGRILGEHSKPHDDALVVVARYMGRSR
jgi:negative regulator of sigma-B (phosphoserine phosphatase)